MTSGPRTRNKQGCPVVAAAGDAALLVARPAEMAVTFGEEIGSSDRSPLLSPIRLKVNEQ